MDLLADPSICINGGLYFVHEPFPPSNGSLFVFFFYFFFLHFSWFPKVRYSQYCEMCNHINASFKTNIVAFIHSPKYPICTKIVWVGYTKATIKIQTDTYITKKLLYPSSFNYVNRPFCWSSLIRLISLEGIAAHNMTVHFPSRCHASRSRYII